MIDSNDKPPFFVGSMFRGALGMALKRTVCVNPTYQCEGCFSAKECLYYEFYEEKNVFHMFRLDIVLQPKSFDYSLYLFEEATRSLAYVLSAIQKAAEEEGYGKERKKMKIKQISVSRQIVYDGKEFLPLSEPKPKYLILDSFCPNIRLEFTMPLRIKENNTLARKKIALHTLVGNVHRRVSQLKGEKPSPLGHKVQGDIVHSTLNFVEMKRHSNRQDKGMNMGGLKGSMDIEGLDEKSYEYLKIGEIIGVGKQTVFGLGSYTIKENK